MLELEKQRKAKQEQEEREALMKTHWVIEKPDEIALVQNYAKKFN